MSAEQTSNIWAIKFPFSATNVQLHLHETSQKPFAQLKITYTIIFEIEISIISIEAHEFRQSLEISFKVKIL